jgi:hypothetical protein
VYTSEAAEKKHISNVLCGFVTFGSPLDKIAFFLREQSEHNEYLREQMLRNYHCFKQRAYPFATSLPFTLTASMRRLFDDILWINYHDRHDYVSGTLDFYEKLVNVDCEFNGKLFSFTHGWYWDHKEMFADIIDAFLLCEGTPKYKDRGTTPVAIVRRVRGWRRFRRRKELA